LLQEWRVQKFVLLVLLVHPEQIALKLRKDLALQERIVQHGVLVGQKVRVNCVWF
jgi:hypothetical protein